MAKSKSAFTLIELLVVIAIIAILAALVLPTISVAKDRAKRTTCLNNLHQINLGVRMYCDDSDDRTPATQYTGGMTNIPWIAYKELMKNYVGLHGASSPQDKIFSCPADMFYYDWVHGYVPRSHHDQSLFDYSSYTFNGMNLSSTPTNLTSVGGKPLTLPGIGGRTFSSIKHPSRTVLVAESPAFFPYSWHEPKPYEPGGVQPRGIPLFNDTKNMVSFVDGHVAYINIYFDINGNKKTEMR